MIYYITPEPNRWTINKFLLGWGKEIASRIQVISYQRIFRRKSLRVGTYIFTALDKLSPNQLEMAARAWEVLESYGHGIRLLNHPLRLKRRYELLRTLYDVGINDFNVYRLTECRCPKCFPVFIRVENNHQGPETPLLATQHELDAAIERIVKEGKNRNDRMITEFCGHIDSDGYYRKYSAFVVAGEILPRHILFSRNWMAKGNTRDYNENTFKKEQAFFDHNPHKDRLKRICAIANIDYGRIDYTVINQRVQVFEINTAPQIAGLGSSADPKRTMLKAQFSKKLINAFHLLDLQSSDSKILNVKFDPLTPSQGYRYFGLWILSLTRVFFLRRYEPWVHWRLLQVNNKIRKILSLLFYGKKN
jgi:hypothetical protein